MTILSGALVLFMSWLLVLAQSNLFQTMAACTAVVIRFFDTQDGNRYSYAVVQIHRSLYISSQINYLKFENLSSYFCHAALLTTPTTWCSGYSANQLLPLTETQETRSALPKSGVLTSSWTLFLCYFQGHEQGRDEHADTPSTSEYLYIIFPLTSMKDLCTCFS